MFGPRPLHLTPVERLLLGSLGATGIPGERRARMADHLVHDWDQLWSLAGDQDVRPLLASNLVTGGFADGLTPEARADVTATRIETAAQNLAAWTELESIAAQLGAWRVPVMPLKGVELAHRAFERLDARRCGDIDILVRESDWERAARALAELGYSPVSASSAGIRDHPFHGVPLWREAGGLRIVVELHRQLTDVRYVQVDHDLLWERALASRGDGLWVDMPNEELLVFLALHLPKHDAGLLRLVADIDHLIVNQNDELDWSLVLVTAERWRAREMLHFALDAAATLFGTPLPVSARAATPPAWKRWAVSMLAGPRTMLRPPATERLRVGRFRIAYCLMLTPTRTALRAYRHYMLAPARGRGSGFLARRTGEVSGAARTALVLANAFGEGRAPRLCSVKRVSQRSC